MIKYNTTVLMNILIWLYCNRRRIFMSNTIVINQVLILFFIMIIGFLARKKGIITPNLTKGLTDILVNITSPLIIFTSFQFEFSGEMLASIGKILAFTFFIHLFSLLVGMVLFNKYPAPIKKVLHYTTVFSNCGFMGFPILYGIYGKIGVLYGSFFLVGFNVFVWTAGVMIFTGHREQGGLKKVLFNPNIIAIILGTVAFIFSIKITGPLYSALEMAAEMNTPVSMMVVGSILAEVKPREIFAGFAVYYGSLR